MQQPQPGDGQTAGASPAGTTPSVYTYGGYSTAAYQPPPAVDVEQALARLLDQLTNYDEGRQKLETEGGARKDFERLTVLLQEPFAVQGRYRSHQVALTERNRLVDFLVDLGQQDDLGYNAVHLQVRRRANGMAVFYLCRIRRDFEGGHSLIVQDYYLSPGYPMREPRFVSLMRHGKENQHLRMASFRSSVAALMADQEPDLMHDDAVARTTGSLYGWGYPKADATDRLLYLAARHVFQAMWHEDQEPGFLAARHFDLIHFRQAIELLYFCLSGELDSMRSFLSAPLYRFFEEIYPQPALHAFLVRLPELDGSTINTLAEVQARKLYRTLMSAFRQFLSVEVPWGLRREPVPLNRLLFANVDRLDLMADDLRAHPVVPEAGARLEKKAKEILKAILDTSR